MTIEPRARADIRQKSEVFHKPMDTQERDHCRLALDAAMGGNETDAKNFVVRWGERLRSTLL